MGLYADVIGKGENMVVAVILFVSLAICFVLAAAVMRTQEIEQENRMIQSYMLSMGEFYSGIQSRIEATRRYRHDLAKHIQTLEALLDRYSGADEMKDYMENLKSRYDTLKKQEFCSNEFLNAILTIKLEQCREKSIPVSVQVEDSSYEGVKEVDMVGLLHNLLDNAVEAQERIPEGQETGIWFSAKENPEEIQLEIENCIPKGEKVVFKTQKPRREEHGIGTKVIANLVEKYHGSITYSTDEKTWRFREQVVLKKQKTDGNEWN